MESENKLVKVICDRCGAEIPKGGKIWDMAWCYRMEAAGELKPENEMEEWNICECCKKEILFSITHEQEEEKIEKAKKKTKTKLNHKKIREMKESGMENAQIAEQLQVSLEAVTTSLSQHKEYVTGKNAIDPEEVVSFYRAGWDVAKIADEMRCGDVEFIKKIILRAAAEEAAS